MTAAWQSNAELAFPRAFDLQDITFCITKFTLLTVLSVPKLQTVNKLLYRGQWKRGGGEVKFSGADKLKLIAFTNETLVINKHIPRNSKTETS